jgi:hypothetical protein
MNGTPTSAQIALSSPAVSSAICRDSIAQGPAIRNKGLSSPASNPHKCMAAPKQYF